MRGRSSAGHRVPNMAAFAGHVSPCCRLWTHNSSHGRLHSLRMSTHFLCVEVPPRSSRSLLEITARLPAAPHRTRRSPAPLLSSHPRTHPGPLAARPRRLSSSLPLSHWRSHACPSRPLAALAGSLSLSPSSDLAVPLSPSRRASPSPSPPPRAAPCATRRSSASRSGTGGAPAPAAGGVCGARCPGALRF
jgi:hypothetical protein